MRFKKSKKNWKRAELEELKILVPTMSNKELSSHFNVSTTTIQNTLQKYSIKRDEQALAIIRKKNLSGSSNPNWKGGISQDNKHYQATQRERYPEKKRARDAVYRALKKGILIKPELCEDCGINKAEHAHHEDYSKPLDVEWLCRSCHRKREDGLH